MCKPRLIDFTQRTFAHCDTNIGCNKYLNIKRKQYLFVNTCQKALRIFKLYTVCDTR